MTPREIDAPHPFIRREEFSLVEGPVTIVFPDRLSKESLQFVLEWLRLLERKLTRWSATEAALDATGHPVSLAQGGVSA